ncbi:hypothetical protein [Facklamia sp. 7083-14-GEN3]|uniref:hypothetical protein n=1 Tax=Facklamia sp. 7083-14-GEN3 TaxID=2973478 RepID=UPI00215BDF27|nr:hypothetical protein [Facklamia sp. 7083-14-GEN3]MCR8969531.1 hypothetical protein [Facklamia sp. 7083-14-GEN3]
MISAVETYFEKEDILVPKKYLEIKEEFLIKQVELKVKEITNLYYPNIKELSDDMILNLNLPNIYSYQDLENYFYNDLKYRLTEFYFYDQLLPYLFTFYAETSQTIINQSELLQFQNDYQKKVKKMAEISNMSFPDYVQVHLNLTGNPYDRINERAFEEFVFKLIANQRYEKNDYANLQDEYEAFISDRSLYLNVDPLDLKEQLSLSTFEQDYPTIYFTQELLDYYTPKFNYISKD